MLQGPVEFLQHYPMLSLMIRVLSTDAFLMKILMLYISGQTMLKTGTG